MMRRLVILLCVMLTVLTGCMTLGEGIPPVEEESLSEQEIEMILEDILSFPELISSGPAEGLVMETGLDDQGNLSCLVTADGYMDEASGRRYDGSILTVMDMDSGTGMICLVETMISMGIDHDHSLDLDYRYDPVTGVMTVLNAYVDGKSYEEGVLEHLLIP